MTTLNELIAALQLARETAGGNATVGIVGTDDDGPEGEGAPYGVRFAAGRVYLDLTDEPGTVAPVGE